VIDHIWTVVCSRSVIDRESNNISIQNVLEQVTVNGPLQAGAVIPIEMELVSLWTKTDPSLPHRGQARVTLVSPTGHPLRTTELEIDMSTYERYRTRNRFQGLPVSAPGRHIFRIEVREDGTDVWRQVAAIPLQVNHRRTDRPTGPA
jgi:hypothetical protein